MSTDTSAFHQRGGVDDGVLQVGSAYRRGLYIGSSFGVIGSEAGDEVCMTVSKRREMQVDQEASLILGLVGEQLLRCCNGEHSPRDGAKLGDLVYTCTMLPHAKSFDSLELVAQCVCITVRCVDVPTRLAQVYYWCAPRITAKVVYVVGIETVGLEVINPQLSRVVNTMCFLHVTRAYYGAYSAWTIGPYSAVGLPGITLGGIDDSVNDDGAYVSPYHVIAEEATDRRHSIATAALGPLVEYDIMQACSNQRNEYHSVRLIATNPALVPTCNVVLYRCDEGTDYDGFTITTRSRDTGWHTIRTARTQFPTKCLLDEQQSHASTISSNFLARTFAVDTNGCLVTMHTDDNGELVRLTTLTVWTDALDAALQGLNDFDALSTCVASDIVTLKAIGHRAGLKIEVEGNTLHWTSERHACSGSLHIIHSMLPGPRLSGLLSNRQFGDARTVVSTGPIFTMQTSCNMLLMCDEGASLLGRYLHRDRINEEGRMRLEGIRVPSTTISETVLQAREVHVGFVPAVPIVAIETEGTGHISVSVCMDGALAVHAVSPQDDENQSTYYNGIYPGPGRSSDWENTLDLLHKYPTFSLVSTERDTWRNWLDDNKDEPLYQHVKLVLNICEAKFCHSLHNEHRTAIYTGLSDVVGFKATQILLASGLCFKETVARIGPILSEYQRAAEG